MVHYVEEDLVLACFLLCQSQMASVVLTASKISFRVLNGFCEPRSGVLGLVTLVDEAVVELEYLDVCYYVSLFQIELEDLQRVDEHESGVDS